MSSGDQQLQGHAGSCFATTHWSLVLAAGQRASPEARQALASLCEAYWYPLYAHVRRRGYRAEEAQDLIQEFFMRLLEKDALGMVDPARGRFRSFLLAALDHFLANQWRRAHALKRGGERCFASLRFDSAEARYGSEPSHDLAPDKLYQRRWALTLIDQALTRLRAEFDQGGKLALFERLKHYLGGEGEGEGEADAFCRSGDEGGLAGERSFHGGLLLGWIGLVGLLGFLDAGGAFSGFALVVLEGGDLFLRPKHFYGDIAGGFGDEVIVGVGGEAVGDDLDADGAAGGDDVDDGFAFGIGLDFEVALVLAVLGGVEDDGGVDDGFAVGVLGDSDLDVGGGGWRLVLAAVTDRGIVLSAGDAGRG
jgi:RNA polymerase sigma factor (sigma-70 family)